MPRGMREGPDWRNIHGDGYGAWIVEAGLKSGRIMYI